MREVVDIEAAGGHIGSHKQLRQMLTELLHRQVALLLRQVAMQCLGVVAVLNQFVGNFLRFELGATENDGKNAGIIVYDALQGQILILCLHHIIDMVHVFSAFVARAHHNLLMVFQIVASHAFHLAAHRSREHERVVFGRQCLENVVDSVGKAHVQHLVGLVEHDVLNVFQMRVAAVLQVDESSRRGHDNLYTLAQGPHLLFDGSTAIDGLDVYAVHVFREVAQVVGNLQTEFAGRREHQGLRVAPRCIDALQQRNAESSRFASARLCQCDGIAATFQ